MVNANGNGKIPARLLYHGVSILPAAMLEVTCLLPYNGIWEDGAAKWKPIIVKNNKQKTQREPRSRIIEKSEYIYIYNETLVKTNKKENEKLWKLNIEVIIKVSYTTFSSFKVYSAIENCFWWGTEECTRAHAIR